MIPSNALLRPLGQLEGFEMSELLDDIAVFLPTFGQGWPCVHQVPTWGVPRQAYTTPSLASW